MRARYPDTVARPPCALVPCSLSRNGPASRRLSWVSSWSLIRRGRPSWPASAIFARRGKGQLSPVPRVSRRREPRQGRRQRAYPQTDESGFRQALRRRPAEAGREAEPSRLQHLISRSRASLFGGLANGPSFPQPALLSSAALAPAGPAPLASSLQATAAAARSTSCLRSRKRWILPLGVLGRSSTNSISRGKACADSRLRTCC